MLEFCPMCKSLLQLKKDGDKIIGFCNCGFKRMSGVTVSGEESFSSLERGSGFVDSDTSKSDGFIRICEKCGHDKAEMSQLVSNESEITMFTCLKCGDRIRQSSGGSKA